MAELVLGPAGPAASAMEYSQPSELATVRAFVRDYASLLGLPDDRVAMLTLAVSELTTNTLLHTSGGGVVRLWAESGQVVCDVLDQGPPRSFGEMPAADATGGRGLAIVRRVADDVSTAAHGGHTLVRIRMNR